MAPDRPAGLFEQAAAGQVRASGEVVANPHNQTLNVAIQWGVLGIVVLYAMWLVHLLLFRGDGLVAWIGLLVVVQNIFTSLFNSHIFDFHEGWMYVLGVGVAGGMVFKAGSRQAASDRGIPPDHDGWHARARSAISKPEMGFARYVLLPVGDMTRFSNLTLRNALIAAHDALATALALFASFLSALRGRRIFLRPRAAAAAHPALVHRLQRGGLLRLQPDHHEMAFHFVAGCVEHPARGDRAGGCAAGAGLYFRRAQRSWHAIAPNVLGAFFVGKVTIVLYWFLEVFFLSALRFAYRYFRYTRVRHHARTEGASPTLLIGRAADAEILLRGIESGAVKRIWPVGVLSPSAADRGQSIRNIPVLGGIDDIEDVIARFCPARQADHAGGHDAVGVRAEARPEAVLMRARRLGLIVSRLPSLESGDAPRLTTVAVEDLLLRPSENIDYARLEALVKGKAVIVTGGGGSIGSEICERVATFGAARLLVIENSEPALYAVTEALAARETGAAIEGRIADIRDRERILRLMNEFKPDIVFHAAALKHVPILERDWSEGVKTNIFGSVNVADAALAAGAEAMVMISTDKAIEPVSMLGLTKRFAEMYCQALDHDLAAQVGGQAADAAYLRADSAMCWRRTDRWCRNSRPRSRRAGR